MRQWVCKNPTSQQGGTQQVTVSHNLDRVSTAFDDPNLVADAGLLLPGTLAQHLGLRALLDEHVALGDVPGAPNPGAKAMTVISGMLAGADCIDQMDVLRSGKSAAVVGHPVAAPSTVGIFLRGFSVGHARQLDVVSREMLRRAWQQSAGLPSDGSLTIDVDSTICETYGLQKQGGRFGYTHVRGYHPLVSIASPFGDVLHERLRGGNAHTARNAASFLKETFARARYAGATGELTVRMDSGFYSEKVVKACEHNGVKYSITAKMSPALHTACEAIPENAWSAIDYPFEDGADVAETTYAAFSRGRKNAAARRLIVRRVRPTPQSQLDLLGVKYTYHAFITDRKGSVVHLDADHRRHAQVEAGIRNLKYGAGLNHCPSGRFGANAAWLAFSAMAHNMALWLGRIGFAEEPLVTTETLRRRYLSVPGRLARSARTVTLHLPENWPWEAQFTKALERLRAIDITPMLA
jgi:Transposase DDE domain group 1